MRIRTLMIGTAAAAAGAAAAYAYAVRPWWRAWGVDPDESAMPLPGDDLVPDPTVVETRAIDIDAKPDEVWPWIVQMGYGRAGWYSYDAIDMKGGSLEHIDPALQGLAEGDMIPVAPDAAFQARIVEPGHALVMYADEAMMEEQTKAAAAARQAAAEEAEGTPANLRAATRAMPSMAGFVLSWALVVRELDDGTTRLTERMRVTMPAPSGGGQRVMGEAFGFGVFAMTRKQMLGIRRRAERLSA
jgi:hypothetical protein